MPTTTVSRSLRHLGCGVLTAGLLAFTVVLPTAAEAATTSLPSGGVLRVGQSITSPNGQEQLLQQSDGNVVLYSNGHATWNAGTSGSANRLTLQGDGNLVEYDSAGHALWWSGGSGASSRLDLQDDGNLVTYSGGKATWSSGTTADDLWTGQTLAPGQWLASPSGQQKMIMQGDGNLVVYSNGHATWQSHTGVAGSRLMVQGDGNLVVYSPAGAATWSSGTSGSGAVLTMQDDGNLVLYGAAGALFSTGTAADSLWAVGTLTSGQALVSRNGRQALVMQGDGNLVLYSSGHSTWSSGTSVAGSRVALQADGNLVVYAPSGAAVWSSGSSGSGAQLIVQDDGNVAVYSGGRSTFSTGTHSWSAPGSAVDGPISRAEVLQRAQSWIDEKVPYSQKTSWTDANGRYRQDCSGFVSMTWHLGSSLTTVSLPSVSHTIARGDLQPGDALLIRSDHVAMFLRWSDGTHTSVVVQEESDYGLPALQTTWSASTASQFTPVRYNRIT